MCTDVVIGVVIGKTTAYCRLQRTKEYTKANYSLRAKSQTSYWPVKDVEHILKNVRAAMGSSHATLLIGECAIPDRDRVPIPPILAAIDIQMMAAFPEAKERTPSEWRVLLSKTGFRVVALHSTRSLVQWVEAVPI